MPSSSSHQVDGRLNELTGFGSNPGDLIGRCYIPETMGAGAPLVVVLHGCTQSASSYNRGAGWTSVADEHGFGLLFPEQQRSNNPNLCFNWFSPADASRGRGEALSIAQMVDELCSRHELDRQRVFVTGLSAGGAMAAVMLATYPEVFAGGAVIAGLPFGTATSVPEAFERMRGQPEPEEDHLSGLVTSASDHAGRWPRLSVWHGTSDATVDASNAASLVTQWRGLHGIADTPSTTEKVGGHLRRAWEDDKGVEVIEEFVIGSMGHGTPLDVTAANGGEAAGPYMLDVGISSTREITRFWGLERERKPARATVQTLVAVSRAKPRLTPERPAASQLPKAASSSRVQEVIEKALRSAGLMS